MVTANLDFLLKKALNDEQLVEDDNRDASDETKKKEKPKTDKKDEKDTKKDKDDEIDNKNIGDVEKSDLEKDEIEKGETVVSVNLNKKIKYFDIDEVNEFYDVNAILLCYGIEDISNIPVKFGKKITIKIQSPLEAFKDQKYNIILLDKVGELQINKPDFYKTFPVKSNINQNMEQATQTQLKVGKESEEKQEEKGIDISSYIEQLNKYFQQMVKNEFLDRIVSKFTT
jgi:hypothetical protein